MFTVGGFVKALADCLGSLGRVGTINSCVCCKKQACRKIKDIEICTALKQLIDLVV